MRYYKSGNSILRTVGVMDLPELTKDEYTAEITAMRKRQEIQEKIHERTRPLTVEEVYRMVLAQSVNTLAVDDNTALRMMDFYPEWKPGQPCDIDFKVQRDGKLWKCVQKHTALDGWEPENADSLWTEVCESHEGTEDDPIPYSGNLALEAGKYYMQDWVVYCCNRDTVNPVYNALADLVGLYVEVS